MPTIATRSSDSERFEEKEFLITVDYGQEIQDIIGKLQIISPKAKLLMRLFQEGHSFRIAPHIINGQLSAVSLISTTANKDYAREETNNDSRN